MQRQEQRIAPLPASLQNCGTAVLVGSARGENSSSYEQPSKKTERKFQLREGLRHPSSVIGCICL
ncbi:hypothetical protein PspLS_11586 [Pyricularia sp. CBS 133598]|nr:hypothetical protein PspLS_11586 [Pyricularia sp. CBS 133598]